MTTATETKPRKPADVISFAVGSDGPRYTASKPALTKLEAAEWVLSQMAAVPGEFGAVSAKLRNHLDTFLEGLRLGGVPKLNAE